MWQKGGSMFCHGIEGEGEKEEDDRDIDPDYKDNYDHEDDWDPEELLVNSEEEEKEQEEDDKDAHNNVPIEQMHIVAIVDFLSKRPTIITQKRSV